MKKKVPEITTKELNAERYNNNKAKEIEGIVGERSGDQRPVRRHRFFYGNDASDSLV